MRRVERRMLAAMPGRLRPVNLKRERRKASLTIYAPSTASPSTSFRRGRSRDAKLAERITFTESSSMRRRRAAMSSHLCAQRPQHSVRRQHQD